MMANQGANALFIFKRLGLGLELGLRQKRIESQDNHKKRVREAIDKHKTRQGKHKTRKDNHKTRQRQSKANLNPNPDPNPNLKTITRRDKRRERDARLRMRDKAWG
jgi:hypothetical protein